MKTYLNKLDHKEVTQLISQKAELANIIESNLWAKAKYSGPRLVRII